MGLWIALTDSVKLQELVAGAVVAVLVALVLGLLEPFGEAERRGGGLSARTALRPLLRLALEMPLLVRLLWRRLRHGEAIAGELRLEDSPGGPLLSEWWDSLTPSRYAIGVSDEGERVLVHALPRPGPRGRE
jgi:multisubunit Na+/H+ antiporter MnhE subunit